MIKKHIMGVVGIQLNVTQFGGKIQNCLTDDLFLWPLAAGKKNVLWQRNGG